MYRLCFQRDFTARHALVGGEWGAENEPHAHAYRVEWELSAPQLDSNGYLVDLIDVEKGLAATLSKYRDAFLNDLPEFAGMNPSLERFVKALWDRLSASLPSGIHCLVRLWENDAAWAGYEDPSPARRGA